MLSMKQAEETLRIPSKYFEVLVPTLGQPLKSFRDRDCDFTVYEKGNPEFTYLDTLGTLAKPEN